MRCCVLQETPEKSVFFRNLRAEVIRRYGCGSSEGWINVIAAALGDPFDEVRSQIYRYENFEPQQIGFPMKVARAMNLPVDRLIYDPRNVCRESYYWRVNQELAEKVELAQYERDMALDDLVAAREELKGMRTAYAVLQAEVHALQGRTE